MNRLFVIVFKRVFQSIPVAAGILLVSFFLLHAAPGDMISVLASETQLADPELVAELRRQYGLDQPLPLQFLDYIAAVVQFDLGFSVRDSTPVLDLILERLPATMLLMLAGITVALVVGVAAGLVAALHVDRWPDVVISSVAIFFFAAPSFWVGVMAVALFSVFLGWFPVSGFSTIGAGYAGWVLIADILHHLVLPAMSLGLFYAAIYARVMRASVLEVHGMDFVLTAKAKGLTNWAIARRHIVRNALLPVVNLFGLQLGTVLAGSVVVESVFNWPGIGTLLNDAVQARNLSIVMGVLLLSSFVVILANLLVDLTSAWLDPRIEP